VLQDVYSLAHPGLLPSADTTPALLPEASLSPSKKQEAIAITFAQFLPLPQINLLGLGWGFTPR